MKNATKLKKIGALAGLGLFAAWLLWATLSTPESGLKPPEPLARKEQPREVALSATRQLEEPPPASRQPTSEQPSALPGPSDWVQYLPEPLPPTLTAEEQATIVAELAGNVPTDQVTIDLSDPEADILAEAAVASRPLFRGGVRGSATAMTAPSALAAPSVMIWQTDSAGRYPPGTRFVAILRTDILAIHGQRTHVILEVRGSDGNMLGIALGRATLGRRRVNVEISEIHGARERIRARCVAIEADGAEGLRARLRQDWLGHVGLTLFRTTLGVFALDTAQRTSSGLAGLISAQSGSAILGDVAGALPEDRVSRWGHVPRGYRCQLLLLDETTPRQAPVIAVPQPTAPNRRSSEFSLDRFLQNPALLEDVP